MKDDPRERIETKRIQCAGTPDGWSIGQVGTAYAAMANWAEVVEFARAILAADEAWLDSQTPTLEELRAKYPGVSFGVSYQACGPTYCDYAWMKAPGRSYTDAHFGSHDAALRWLAAILAEVAPVETEQQFRECPACDGRGGIARQVSEDEWYHSPCEVCEGRREVPVEELT